MFKLLSFVLILLVFLSTGYSTQEDNVNYEEVARLIFQDMKLDANHFGSLGRENTPFTDDDKQYFYKTVDAVMNEITPIAIINVTDGTETKYPDRYSMTVFLNLNRITIDYKTVYRREGYAEKNLKTKSKGKTDQVVQAYIEFGVKERVIRGLTINSLKTEEYETTSDCFDNGDAVGFCDRLHGRLSQLVKYPITPSIINMALATKISMKGY